MRLIIYLFEIMSIFLCMHQIYGVKLRINALLVFNTIVLVLNLVIMNTYSLTVEGSILSYLILLLYSIKVFRRGVKETLINTVLYMVIITIIQFLSSLPFTLWLRDNLMQITFYSDILAFIVIVFVVPRLELSKIAKWAQKRNIVLYISLAYLFIYCIFLLAQIKIIGKADIDLFIFLAPFAICVFLILKEWYRYYALYEQKEQELKALEENNDKRTELIKQIRLRQHEFSNHLMAILAMHYTKSTYEELVAEQKLYCNHILKHNKYNNLLSLYNSVSSGFLYAKMKELEKMGIDIECRVCIKDYETELPEYYLIEMLGILLDNAREAQDSTEFKKIEIEIVENGNKYEFIVRNPFEHVTYEEISKWFEYGVSSKGYGRGIGLYRLKCLCKEWNCLIICRSAKRQNREWIEFKIVICRKED